MDRKEPLSGCKPHLSGFVRFYFHVFLWGWESCVSLHLTCPSLPPVLPLAKSFFLRDPSVPLTGSQSAVSAGKCLGPDISAEEAAKGEEPQLHPQ